MLLRALSGLDIEMIAATPAGLNLVVGAETALARSVFQAFAEILGYPFAAIDRSYRQTTSV